MKAIYLLALTLALSYHAARAQQLRGRVISKQDGLPIRGATIRQSGLDNSTLSDLRGRFVLGIHPSADKQFVIEHQGYRLFTTSIMDADIDTLTVRLEPEVRSVDSVTVVSTGYQQLPRERATGSFSSVDRELFNQQVGPDIISRLPAIASSITTDNSLNTPRLMVRGLSTIQGPRDPLIVVDNFPYEGDINNINPNIVESITILKDAAASSIWGARAANGVIVITTKKGLFDRPISVEFNSHVTITTKPDLGYIRQMSSADYIDMEVALFNRGFYNSRISSASRLVISPVVDMLSKLREGSLEASGVDAELQRLRGIDARDQLNQHMYRAGVNQQYYLGLQGGSEKLSWSSAAGYDRNRDNLGEGYRRLNLRFENTYKPLESLSIRTGIYYTESGTRSGRLGYGGIFMNGGVFVPYMELADQDGQPKVVFNAWNNSYINSVGQGVLQDWNYYPLTDWQHNTSSSRSSNMLATAALDYKILPGLNASVNYQFERQYDQGTTLADPQSYMARDFVNRYTQINNQGQASYAVPRGGIKDLSGSMLRSNNVRGQMAYDRDFGDEHHISGIIGLEMRSVVRESDQHRLYGYNPDNMTSGLVDFTRSYPSFISGSSFIPNNQFVSATQTRFLSQYGNAAYTYRGKYTLSGSVRRDASNLFGLNTNDQWNPFWSVGGAWKISEESFFSSNLIDYLNLRATYGFSGNIDPAMAAVNTIRYLPGNSNYTGRPVAVVNNYYNPSLRWETSNMINLAADVRMLDNRIVASVEYFRKKGTDLFGAAPLDYTTGIPPYTLRNVASMSGNGVDLELKTINIQSGGLEWTSIVNYSFFKDQIEQYLINRTLANQYVNPSNVPISGVAGKPVYSVFAYPWASLDSQTGAAQGYLDGEISTDYRTIIGAGTTLEELEFFGSSIPTSFGSFINSFGYKRISLQVGISFKFGYWFRRGSIHYTNLFNSWRGHSDYASRWQQPGDELNTDIPANMYSTDSQRDNFYAGSSALVEKGDHIRLQYINLNYRLPLQIAGRQHQVQLYVNANNLGILWRANMHGIDPDFNNTAGTRLIRPAGYTIGMRANF
ncbi:SusC/RagA family TonB-linked outer membrane protein [Sphingobacterium sp. UME9]|uniref:SusC/RagA family TonB-linked outer membrane protein n=1 Tax=Sphingobacterium sp. UME9 TaxID=1862316 RepID=UPI001603961E|nr:SusC/RagA family TonB-linked outer membrane protein [Sphingobacterium sp. UME9]MBB1643619.1 hypothetical protein [Sphingobacterium sp. UME9]